MHFSDQVGNLDLTLRFGEEPRYSGPTAGRGVAAGIERLILAGERC